ncbi:similar to Saccharomyces cerevisiae YJL197W UBP12 Ubiquitin carboxyl-terminal hydrolase [Maudiozyma saulgeensis]|uniref:ubiquitinyl hydrolase 1 n=1 Tax=Maudiozyma saulgeensis TaxID=1789683 RepID=A0A1X7R1P8_9SACH|nr:similar to Saccharomyces cerevisiae YJL197W UBP12 Ubiquitin carboxyl-terminal hydrolase [Kazachstania saulgeensis]
MDGEPNEIIGQNNDLTDLNIELLDKSLTDQINLKSSEDNDETSSERNETQEDGDDGEKRNSEIYAGDINNDDQILEEQRREIIRLIKLNREEEREGDRVYIIPKGWYELFFNTELKDSTKLGPIAISSIVRDYKNFLLKDYETNPYTSLPETVFIKLVEWYGMSEDSKPLYTYLIRDQETGKLVTEYNKIYFRIQYLKAPENRSRSETSSTYRDINNSNFFTASAIDTLKDSMTKVVEYFFDIENDLDIEKLKIKVWYVNSRQDENQSGDNSNSSSYLVDEIQFLSSHSRTHITKDLLNQKLRDLNMLSGNFVVEVIQSHKNYHWVSNYLNYNKIQPGRGIMGLQNLGNTCYMNSALQCLVHIPQLRDYFLYNGFQSEINATNPLGYQGYMANAFSSLIHNLFAERLGSNNNATSMAPTHFKSTIGHINNMFSGYLQQDSQEFLAFLLDSLHEDLNRIIDKPYIEKPSLSDSDDVDDFETVRKLANDTWETHLRRNDSVITDLFVGMYKSTLECPECNNVSVTFDPYNDLTLPLPVDSVWKSKVRIFPQNSPPCTLEVELDKNATFQDLKEYIAKKAQLDVNNIYGCDIFSHQFYNNFESNNSQSNFLGVKELISENDLVIFYEIQAEKGDTIIPVLNTSIEDGFTSSRLFGIPFFISLSPSEINNPLIVRRKLENQYKYLSGGYIHFPSQNKEYDDNDDGSAVSIDKFQSIREKYPDVDLEKYTEYLKYANPTVLAEQENLTPEVASEENNPEGCKKFFDIKIINGLDDRMLSKSSNDSKRESPVFWTPPGHMNYRGARDINDFMDPIIADIYNYGTSKENANTETQENDVEMSDEEKKEEEENVAVEEELLEQPQEENEAMDVEDLEDLKVELNEEKMVELDTPNFSDLFKDNNTVIVCEWNTLSVDEAFTSDKIINWERPGVLENKELDEMREVRSNNNKKKLDITLGDCLKLFSKKEVLGVNDSWYCPKCKEHRQASKRIQIWNTPDILLIHLKRFESSRSFSDKITEVVKFPITNLDMRYHVVDQEDPRGYIYDLIAVDNHFGGIGGGHYTAYVKNCVDNQWYYFNDGHVTEAVPEDSIAGSAYLLFYLRRPINDDSQGDIGYGSERLREILNESRSNHDTQLEQLNRVQAELYETNKTDAEDMSEEEEKEEDEEEDMQYSNEDESSSLDENKSGEESIQNSTNESNPSLSDVNKISENDNDEEEEEGDSDSTNSDRKRIRLIQDHVTSTS